MVQRTDYTAQGMAGTVRPEGDVCGGTARIEEHSAYFQSVLRSIIESVKKLVGATRAGFLLFDEDNQELVLQRPAIGFADDFIPLARLRLDSPSLTVNAFRSGHPHMSNDVMSERFAAPIRKLAGSENSIAVLLKVGKRRIGAFHVGNKPGGFTKNDLDIIRLLASHLSVLIHNVYLLEGQRCSLLKLQQVNRVVDQQREGLQRTVLKLQEMNQIIDRQRASLQRTVTIHDDLTRMVLDGQGPELICVYLGQLLANPIVVKDRFENSIGAYGEGSTDAKWLDALCERRLSQVVASDVAIQDGLARLRREHRPARLAANAQLGLDVPVVVAPVVVGHETLGYVCVPEVRRTLDELDMMAVERAATAIALEMMKEKAVAETQYKLVSDLVADLVDGTNVSAQVLLRRATCLGIDLRTPRAVLVIDVDECFATNSPEEKVLPVKAQLLDVVTRAARHVSGNCLIASKSSEVIVLAEKVNGTNPQPLVQAADFIRAEVRCWSPEISVSVGMGSYTSDWTGIPESYREARSALDVVRAARQHDRTVAFDQLGACAILFDPRISNKLIPIVRRTLGALMDYDGRHGTELLETLEQYLRQGCRLDPTAAQLRVQNTTVRYRLRRVEEISGTDLRDPDSRFNLQLTIRLWRVLNLP